MGLLTQLLACLGQFRDQTAADRLAVQMEQNRRECERNAARRQRENNERYDRAIRLRLDARKSHNEPPSGQT